jgi:hypothetical protein
MSGLLNDANVSHSQIGRQLWIVTDVAGNRKGGGLTGKLGKEVLFAEILTLELLGNK